MSQIGEYIIKFLVEGQQAETQSKKTAQGLDAVDKSAKNAAKSTKDLQASGKGLSDMFNLTALAAGASVGALVAFTIQSVKVGAQLQVLRSSFKGTAADIELLRKATAGTVSEANLIKLSNQASDLGLNLETQAKLFSLAEDAADKYGGGVEENFQKIVLATDGSQRGLRAVGIATKDFEQKLKELTDARGVAITKMSAEEQLQIRLQAIFELTGTTMESVRNKTADAADAMEQLSLVGETLTSNFGVGLVEAFSASMQRGEDFQKTLKDIGKTAEDIGQDIGRTAAGIVTDLKWLWEKAEGIIKAIKVARNFFTSPIGFFLNSGEQDPTQGMTWDEYWAKTIDAGGLDVMGPGNDAGVAEFMSRPPSGSTSPGSGTSRGSRGSNTAEVEKVKDLLKGTLGFSLENASIAIGSLLADALFKVTGTAVDIPGGEFGRGIVTGIDQTEEARKKAVDDSVAVYQNISGILNVFEIGVDSFVNKMLSFVNDFVTIFTTIRAVNSILGFLPGFASGGSVPGMGSGDVVPAMLTPGEFVVRKSVVDRVGSGFLEWMNGGGMFSSNVRGYANGGMVSAGGASPVYIVGAKVEGSALRLVLDRANKADARRLL